MNSSDDFSLVYIIFAALLGVFSSLLRLILYPYRMVLQLFRSSLPRSTSSYIISRMDIPTTSLLRRGIHYIHYFFWPHQTSGTVYPILSRQIQRRKFILVLDLDETLVHTSEDINNMQPFHHHRIEVFNKRTSKVFYVKQRPFLDVFLDRISKFFEIVVFTASLKKYADPIIDLIDSNRIIRRRYFRESCIIVDGNLVKDLRVVSHDLSRIIIIDNTSCSYFLNQCNAIPISSWFDNQDDNELLDCLPMLIALRQLDDVRSILQFRLKKN